MVGHIVVTFNPPTPNFKPLLDFLLRKLIFGMVDLFKPAGLARPLIAQAGQLSFQLSQPVMGMDLTK